MFSLRNNDDLAPFKAPLRYEKNKWAILRYSRAGPIFGWGSDLFIANNAGSTTLSYTKFGAAYQLPPGYTLDENNTNSLLPGSKYFRPSEIEVLYIN